MTGIGRFLMVAMIAALASGGAEAQDSTGALPAPSGPREPPAAGSPPAPAPPPVTTPRIDSTPPLGSPTPLGPVDAIFGSPDEPVQPPRAPFVVDRVVAVVGNRPVLASQVEEQLFTLLAQPGAPVPRTPADSAAVRRQILQDIVDEELLVQEAQRDTSIKVTDQEVDEGVEQQVKNIRAKFSSELDYRTELRKAGFQSPEEYRRYVADQQRRSFYQSRLMEKLRGEGQLKPVPPTEKEMRAYFETQKHQLGQRPATTSFQQIVVRPEPADTAKVAARALADSIILELRGGADFATAAKRFSEDPGSKDKGGSLGWTRRGSWVAEFERVAFALKPGVISNPVESPFGFHIIQVERTQPAEVLARHILITPTITEADDTRARAEAERLRKLVIGGASFDSLQRLHHDPTEEREAPEVPVEKLPEAYAKAMAGADSGAVVPVFPLDGPNGRQKFAVLQVTGRRPEGEIRFQDVRDRVRERLAEQLAVRRYLDRLRNSTYTEIRES